jgi:hypothetical protein
MNVAELGLGVLEKNGDRSGAINLKRDAINLVCTGYLQNNMCPE